MNTMKTAKIAKKKEKKTLTRKTILKDCRLYNHSSGMILVGPKFSETNGRVSDYHELDDILPDTCKNGYSQIGTFEFIVKFTPNKEK